MRVFRLVCGVCAPQQHAFLPSSGALAALLIVVVASLSIALSPDAAAQTLQHALSEAYRTNPELSAARANLRATDEEVSRAHAAFRPVVSGTATTGWTRTDTDPPSSTLAGTTHPRTLGLALAQPIFRGFRSVNQLRVAEATVRAEREKLRVAEGQVLLQAATAFADVIRDEGTVGANQNIVASLTRLSDATRIQFDRGAVTRTDVAQATARLARARSTLEAAKARLAASHASYEQVIGTAPRKLTAPALPRRLLPRSPAETRTITTSENGTILNAHYLAEAGRYTILQIRGELLPTVALDANYTRQYEQSPVIDSSQERSARLSMRVPIYSGGEVEARVRQAKHAHVNKLELLRQAKADQLRQATSAWANYVAADAQRRSASTQTEAFKTVVSGVRLEFQRGTRTLLDVLNAEQEYFTSQVDEITTQRELLVQAFTLLHLIGRLNAGNLGLGADPYDPQINYLAVRRNWFGLDITYADGSVARIDASMPEPGRGGARDRSR